MPPMMTRGLFKSLHELGAIYGHTGDLDAGIARRLAKGERHTWLAKLLLYVMTAFGLTDSYWNGQLKKNQAFEKRFDRPYVNDDNS